MPRTSGVESGSSPLARGTPGRRTFRRSRHGLIPARAGNTITPPLEAYPPGAHPRSRGEHVESRSGGQRDGGSSPLARGTQEEKLAFYEWSGLIPARAGNTVDIAAVHKPSRAHPRSRGEHA